MAAMADRLFVSNRLKFPLRHESQKIDRETPQSRIILIKNSRQSEDTHGCSQLYFPPEEYRRQ
jgi:hypothetical protein